MVGCILIPGYLNPSEQVDLLTSALAEYTLPPNPLSLSTHYDLPPNLFGTYITNPEYKVQTLFSKLSPDEQEAIRTREQEIGHRVTKESKSGSEVGYEKILQSGKVWEGDVPGSQLSERSVGELMKELRWANLGWVYRVSLVCFRVRRKEKADNSGRLNHMISIHLPLSPFQQIWGRYVLVSLDGYHGNKSLATVQVMISGGRIGKMIIVSRPIQLIESITKWPGPDSGIVNFYQMKDTLMAHADRAEYVFFPINLTFNGVLRVLIYRLDPNRPLISIS